MYLAVSTPGNITSQLAILLWFPLSLGVASLMSARNALFVIVWGGVLFLPEKVILDLPVVDLDKHALSAACAWIAISWMHPEALRNSPSKGTTTWLLVISLLSCIMTTVTNTDSLVFGPRRIPGLGFSDITNNFSWLCFHVVVPFHLASSLFRTPEDIKLFLRNFVVAGLLYMPLVLLEVRLAPWLHRSVYGFLQHSWVQQKREGGFRALVFMQHGLAVALFVSQSVMATAALCRTKQVKLPLSLSPKLVVWPLFVTLVVSKSLASLVYSVVAVPLIWLTSPSMVAGIARIFALLVLAYPLLRLYDWVPTEWILEHARAFDTDRAASLQFRFDNEDILLDRAHDRFLFGWGGWGRNRVLSPVTGRDLSVADGAWVIVLGSGGLLRFFLQFGVFVLPVLKARKAIKGTLRGHPEAMLIAALALILALSSVDLIPNGLFTDLPTYLAGALYSVAKWQPAMAGQMYVPQHPIQHAPIQPST